MRIPSLGLVLPCGLALGASLCISKHGLHFSPSSKHPDSFQHCHSFNLGFWLFYRSGLQDWGTVNGTQTGISKHSF